jgi:branched-chain amino acid transport system ATP-binding protein
MLTIARTLTGNSEFLPLDEQSEGLAPLVVEVLGGKLAELKALALTILLAEPRADLRPLADRVYMLEKSMIRYSGAVAGAARSPLVAVRRFQVCDYPFCTTSGQRSRRPSCGGRRDGGIRAGP